MLLLKRTTKKITKFRDFLYRNFLSLFSIGFPHKFRWVRFFKRANIQLCFHKPKAYSNIKSWIKSTMIEMCRGWKKKIKKIQRSRVGQITHSQIPNPITITSSYENKQTLGKMRVNGKIIWFFFLPFRAYLFHFNANVNVILSDSHLMHEYSPKNMSYAICSVFIPPFLYVFNVCTVLSAFMCLLCLYVRWMV